MQIRESHEQENEQSICDPMLDDLAVEINQALEKCEDAAKTSVGFAIQAGEALIKAKKSIAHGKWAKWLEQNCKCSHRQAQRYMQLANELPHSANATRVSQMSMREAFKLLAADEQAPKRKKHVKTKPATDAGAVPVSQINCVGEQMSNPTGSDCEEKERVAVYAYSTARTEDQRAVKFAEPIRRASKEENRPHSSIARPPLNAPLTFAEGTPEATWLDKSVADIQADAMKCAERITNQAMETGDFDARYVQQALLKNLARRLESVIAE